jgi:hypothetical protein
MSHLNLAQFRATPLETEPFEYLIVPGFVKPESIAAINATFPSIVRGGLFPVDSLGSRAPLRELIAELDGPEFEAAVAEKFQVDLSNKPKMYSLRGYLRAKDGRIHTDSRDKIITVLVYFNERWEHAGGRLRLLRDASNLDNFVVEVPPERGMLLVFKRSESSWHGHHPFEGQRRALQMNWMTSGGRRGFHAIRHRLSALLKRLTAFQTELRG